MFVNNLKTQNFRNLEDQEIEFSSGINLFVGENGQGKTNILEAIYILSTGKTFRSSKPKECINWEKETAALSCFLTDRIGETNLSITLKENSKEAKVNGNSTKSFSDFVGKLLVVAFYPDELEIVRGSSSLRRQLIDKLIVDINPINIKSLVSYQKALKNKQEIRDMNLD